MKLKIMLEKIKEKQRFFVDYKTLREENKLLKKQLEESKKSEIPYINKITKQNIEIRSLKMLVGRYKKKMGELEKE